MNLVGPSQNEIMAPLSPALLGSSLLDSQESSMDDDYDGHPAQIRQLQPPPPPKRQMSTKSHSDVSTTWQINIQQMMPDVRPL